jgi:hypothetical protein
MPLRLQTRWQLGWVDHPGKPVRVVGDLLDGLVVPPVELDPPQDGHGHSEVASDQPLVDGCPSRNFSGCPRRLSAQRAVAGDYEGDVARSWCRGDGHGRLGDARPPDTWQNRNP